MKNLTSIVMSVLLVVFLFLPLEVINTYIAAFTEIPVAKNIHDVTLAASIMNPGADTIPATSKIISKNAELKLISSQFSFTEGPAVDKNGSVFFTDQPNNKIWKYDTNGQLSLFLEKSGRSNGMYFDKKGNLVSCADETNQLWSVDPAGTATILVTNYQGQRLNGPNDIWIHPNGNIYITDPYYQRAWWERKSPDIKGEKVYCLLKGQKELIMVADSFMRPNGIIGTADGKYLYVADIKDNKTYRFRIQKDGKLKEQTLFVPQGSDGMTIDNKGNIYLTGNGVTVYNSKGEKIEHIDVPAKWTANICFGGKDRRELFITASESIYTLQMKVKGVN